MSDFDNGLFGCFDDIVTCLLVCFVPCYQVPKTKAKLDTRVRPAYQLRPRPLSPASSRSRALAYMVVAACASFSRNGDLVGAVH